MKNKSYEAYLKAKPCGENDWKASPDDVLHIISRQLEEYGLEILIYDTKGDFFAWTIERTDTAPVINDTMKACLHNIRCDWECGACMMMFNTGFCNVKHTCEYHKKA